VLPQNRLLVSGFAGTLVIGTLRDEALHERRQILQPKGIRCSALNHFGTSLACAHVSDGGLSAVFPEKGNIQGLEPCSSRVEALAFTQKSRYLAAGTADGEVHLLDMSRRLWSAALLPEPVSAGRVDTILGVPDGGLIVLHDKSAIVCRGREGELLHQRRFATRISTMDHDPGSGRIAFGDEEGRVAALDRSLAYLVDPRPVHEGQVTCVRFIAAGAAFLSAGRDGKVHRIEL
jgi:hypothetical protein